MKNYSKIIAVSALVALSVNSQATTYLDSTGEIISASILDISSVEVNNTATDLIFKINLVGDPVATDWGKYMIGLDTIAGGDSAGNGWARPISMPGMDYWVGSWVDGTPTAQLHQYTGSWANIGAPSITKDSSSVTITTSLASLGVGPGSTLNFDVYTSGGGGGDGAIDALSASTQSIANWGDAFSTQSPLSYTIPVVPEPTSLALLGIGASLLINRLRRR